MPSRRRSPETERAEAAYVKARRAADRVLDRTALTPVQRAYETAASRVSSGLGRLLHGRLGEALLPETVTRAAGWLTERLSEVSRAVGLALSGSTRIVLASGYQATADVVSFVRQSASPLDDLTRLHRAVSLRQRELDRLRTASARGVMDDVNATLIDRIQRFPVEEMSVSDMVSAVGETLASEDWRVDRLVRTETSYAYNLAQRDAVLALSQEAPFQAVYSRWTEHVDDFTRVKLDNRVGRDSVWMHGQLAPPGGYFMTAAGAPDPRGEWEHPPNRPNDRGILTPWMREWGIPGWILRAGRRLDL